MNKSKTQILKETADRLGIPVIDVCLSVEHDAHIETTHMVAKHEYFHAVTKEDYLMAMEWSLLWYNTLYRFNIAQDYVLNLEVVR